MRQKVKGRMVLTEREKVTPKCRVGDVELITGSKQGFPENPRKVQELETS